MGSIDLGNTIAEEQPLNRATLFWLLGAIFFTALAPRLVIAALAPAAGGDWETYSNVATNISLHGCVSLSPPDSGICKLHWGGNQLPGYPAFVAAIWSAFPGSSYAAAAGQSIAASAAIAYLTGHLARARDLGSATLAGLGAIGEGGAVVTNDEKVAAHVRLLRDFGRTNAGDFAAVGFNYRMETLQAAFLRTKLPTLTKSIARRREIASIYDESLRRLSTLPYEPPQGHRVAPYVYPFFSEIRDRLGSELKQRGIETGIHYQLPVHLCSGYTRLDYRKGDFPVAEQAAETEISLPLYPSLSDEEVAYVCESVASTLRI